MGCTTMSTESTGPARAGSSSQGIRRELKDATRGTEIMGLFKERGFVGDDESADSLLQHIARRRRLAIIPLQGSREDRRVRRGKPGARVLRHCYDIIKVHLSCFKSEFQYQDEYEADCRPLYHWCK